MLARSYQACICSLLYVNGDHLLTCTLSELEFSISNDELSGNSLFFLNKYNVYLVSVVTPCFSTFVKSFECEPQCCNLNADTC